MIRELENLLNKIEEEPSLLFDPGYVISIEDKTISVGLNNKLGKLTDVQVIGNYFPIVDDKGLVIRVGKFKLPFFYPQLKENMTPGSYGSYTYSDANVSDQYDTGSTEENRDLIIAECLKYNLGTYEIACVLANAEGEVGENLIPIVEGMGTRKESVYYGRGFAQLTSLPNYTNYNSILKEHFKSPPDIVENPDAVLNKFISAFILVHGMVNGTFTTKKISDYVNADGTITRWGETQDILRGYNASSNGSAESERRSRVNKDRGEYWVKYLQGNR